MLLSLIGQLGFGQNVQEKRVQVRKSRCRRFRHRQRPHRPARRRVQHPKRYLLDVGCRRPVRKAASRQNCAAAADHLTDVNCTSEPRVPAVDNDRVESVAVSPMGLVAWGCTIRSGRTAPSDTGRRLRKASSQWTRGRPCTNNSTGPLDGGSPAPSSLPPPSCVSRSAQRASRNWPSASASRTPT